MSVEKVEYKTKKSAQSALRRWGIGVASEHLYIVEATSAEKPYGVYFSKDGPINILPMGGGNEALPS